MWSYLISDLHFLSFSDPIQYYLSFPEQKKNPLKNLSVWERVSFLPGYFWQVAASLLCHSGTCKNKNRWGSFGTK